MLLSILSRFAEYLPPRKLSPRSTAQHSTAQVHSSSDSTVDLLCETLNYSDGIFLGTTTFRPSQLTPRETLSPTIPDDTFVLALLIFPFRELKDLYPNFTHASTDTRRRRHRSVTESCSAADLAVVRVAIPISQLLPVLDRRDDPSSTGRRCTSLKPPQTRTRTSARAQLPPPVVGSLLPVTAGPSLGRSGPRRPDRRR